MKTFEAYFDLLPLFNIAVVYKGVSSDFRQFMLEV